MTFYSMKKIFLFIFFMNAVFLFMDFTPSFSATPSCGTSSAPLQLKLYTNSCGTNQVQDIFEVVNNGAPVTLSDITIKFWADETSASNLTGSIFYGGCVMNPSCSHPVTGVGLSGVQFSPACGSDANHQANWEITVSNTDHALLNSGASWSNLQTSVHRADWQNFTPGTGKWYSRCVGSGSYNSDTHYALYLKGNLVTASGGVPPSCRPIPTCTPTFTPTETFTPTKTFTPTPTFTPTLAVIFRPTPTEVPGDEGDDAQAREEMFRFGRTARGSLTAAERWLMALQQASLLPVVGAAAPMGLRAKSVGLTNPGCDWSEDGPSPLIFPTTMNLYGNVSGRVTGLAIDSSSNLYLGAAFGGVWKSVNGGINWTVISDPNQSLAVGSIAVHPTNPSIIYIGTGESNFSADSYYGVGILKTTVGGGAGNWTTSNTATRASSTNAALGNNFSMLGLSIGKIVIDPTNPLIINAAAIQDSLAFSLFTPNPNYAGIYRSTDGGNTWQFILPPALFTVGFARACSDIVCDATGSVYYAAYSNAGIFKSTDKGLDWVPVTSPFASYQANVVWGDPNATPFFARASLAVRGTTLWALISDGFGDPAIPSSGLDTGLVQSTNQGSTWTRLAMPVVPGGNLFNEGGGSQGMYDQYVAAPPGGADLVVGGINVWRTASLATVNWINQTKAYSGGTVHPDQHAIAFKNATNWVIGCDGGVWSTANAGSSWSDQNNNIGTIQFTSVSPDFAGSDVFFGGAQDNGVSKKRTGSLTWDVVLGGDGGYTDNNVQNNSEYLSEQSDISFASSLNSGGSFSTILTGSTLSNDHSAFYVPFKAIAGSPSSTIILGTTRVWRGPSNTSTGWSPISPFLVANDSPSKFIQALDADIYGQEICASTSDYINNVFGVQLTLDNAGTWVDVTGNLSTLAPGRPINCVAMDRTDSSPTSFLYAAVQGFNNGPGGHVFKSNMSNAAVWTDISGNLPDAPANWVLVDPANHTDIYVATDVGVFVTQNNGASWSKMGTQLPETAILQLKITDNCPRQIVATTHGRGAWTICPLSTNYQYVKHWNGQQTPGGSFNTVWGTAVSGNFVYVSDLFGNRVHKFDTDGNWIETFGGTGVYPAPGEFDHPSALATGVDGKLYVLEQGTPGSGAPPNPRVQVYDPGTGTWTVVIDGTVSGGGVGTGAVDSLLGVRGIAVDAQGSIYITDTQSNGTAGNIHKFNSAGVIQPPNYTVDVTASALAMDQTNQILYSGSGPDHIQKLNIAVWPPTILRQWGTAQAFTGVGALAVGPGPEFNLYEVISGGAAGGTDFPTVYSPAGDFIGRFPPGPIPTTGGLSGSLGIAVDSCKDLFATSVFGFVEKYGLCGSSCTVSSLVPMARRPSSSLVNGNQGTVSPTPSATPTLTPSVTATPTIGAIAVVAGPNISRGGEPVNFHIALPRPATVRLTLFTITGEQVYQTSVEQSAGNNKLTWDVQTQANHSVASGLYLYTMEVTDDLGSTRHSGKVAVLR